MGTWDATTFDAKDNLLRVVRHQAEGMFEMASSPDAWTAPTACTEWQVRDVIGHMIDVTESYFTGWEAAKGGPAVPDALGTNVMQTELDSGAKIHRELSQADALARLKSDYDKMMGLAEALGPEDWGGLMVPHKYMGTLPAFFYPVFHLMDYGVHSWDIRQGSGRAHALDGDAADLLVPFMFILWSATTKPAPDDPTVEVGVRVTGGNNAGSWKVSAGPEGVSYAPSDLSDVGTVLEFDPGSFVLTAFGRSNAGTIRGDAATADAFLNRFFRI
jgi:uncharacterized protein (TIGR03083 family)